MKTFLILIVIILVVVGGFFVFRDKARAPIEEATLNTSPTVETPKLNGIPINDTNAVMEDGTKVENIVVTYTDSGFSPKTINVKQGETVTFVNQSSGSMWVASDDHPDHDIYPAFDQKASVAKGESWSFSFDKVGGWSYHDHRKASRTGIVIVK